MSKFKVGDKVKINGGNIIDNAVVVSTEGLDIRNPIVVQYLTAQGSVYTVNFSEVGVSLSGSYSITKEPTFRELNNGDTVSLLIKRTGHKLKGKIVNGPYQCIGGWRIIVITSLEYNNRTYTESVTFFETELTAELSFFGEVTLEL